MLQKQNCIFAESPQNHTEQFSKEIKPFSFKIEPYESHEDTESIKESYPKNTNAHNKRKNANGESERPNIQVIKVRNSKVMNSHDLDLDDPMDAKLIGFKTREYTEINSPVNLYSDINSNNDNFNDENRIKMSKTEDEKSNSCQTVEKNLFENSQEPLRKKEKEESKNKNISDIDDDNSSDNSEKENMEREVEEKGQIKIYLPKRNKIEKSRNSEQKMSNFGMEKVKQRQSEHINNLDSILTNYEETKKESNNEEEPKVSKEMPQKSTKIMENSNMNRPLYSSSVIERFIMSPIKQGYIMENLMIIENGFLGFGTKYYLKQKENNEFLCSAKKQMMSFTSEFVLSLGNSHFSKRDSEFVGQMEGSFGGKEWDLSCPIIPSKLNEGESCTNLRRVMSLEYSSSVLGSNVFREMEIKILDPEVQERRKTTYAKEKLIRIKSVKPTFQKGRYSLDFKGIAKMPSNKNFILQTEEGQTCLIFAKQNENTYQMNIAYPFNLIQGFSLCLASLDGKLFVS